MNRRRFFRVLGVSPIAIPAIAMGNASPNIDQKRIFMETFRSKLKAGDVVSVETLSETIIDSLQAIRKFPED